MEYIHGERELERSSLEKEINIDLFQVSQEKKLAEISTQWERKLINILQGNKTVIFCIIFSTTCTSTGKTFCIIDIQFTESGSQSKVTSKLNKGLSPRGLDNPWVVPSDSVQQDTEMTFSHAFILSRRGVIFLAVPVSFPSI